MTMMSRASRIAMLLSVASMIVLIPQSSSKPLGPIVRLPGGVDMPTVGLGNSGSCGPDDFGTADGRPCAGYNATLQWFENGGRAAHDALSYCNQYGVGRAAADFIANNTKGVQRKDLFLMSMVPKFLMGYNETIAAVKASLQQMKLEYLDLVMIHHRCADITDWPREVCPMKAFTPDDVPWMTINESSGKALWMPPPCATNDASGSWLQCQDDTWKALLELKAQGKVRAIGVSNWRLENLKRMKQLGMELPAVNQVEMHVGYHEDDLLDWCRQHGILIQAASPIGRSMMALVEPGANEEVTAIANRYSKSPAQVALRFLLDKGVGVIPSSSNPKYQKENLNLFDFCLNQTELQTLNRLAIPCRGSAALGLQKCWADPGTMMCMNETGTMFHCP